MHTGPLHAAFYYLWLCFRPKSEELKKKKKKRNWLLRQPQAMDLRTIWLMAETHCREPRTKYSRENKIELWPSIQFDSHQDSSVQVWDWTHPELSLNANLSK